MEMFCPKCGKDKAEDKDEYVQKGHIIKIRYCAHCGYKGIFAFPLKN